MKKILFTGAGGAGSEALFRLLSDRREIHFADADTQAIDPVIPEDRRHQIPFANDPTFGKKLSDLFQTLEIDLLVPGVDEELPPVAALVEAGRLHALLPPKRFVETHLDKLASARALGGSAPRTVPAEEAETLGFPCLVKPRRGRGSRGVAVIRSVRQLEGYLALYGTEPESAVAQELATGREYTVLMAADTAGNLRAIVPVAVEVKRGITLRAHTARDRAVEEACRAVHAADPVSGCYNIQLMRDSGGRVRIFEINPRVSTTLCLGVAAGVDPVEIFLSPPAGGGLLPFREALQLRRHWINRFDPPAEPDV